MSQVMSRLLLLIGASAALASAGTLYLPAYPNAVIVFDEAKGQIVDRIPLTTGTPLSIRQTPDHKTIYVTTIDHNGIEVIDVATRKVTNHFVLNTPTKQFRMWNGTPDPQGKLFYTVTQEIDKYPEHYDLGKPKYTVIDLAQQRIIKTVEMPKEDQAAEGEAYGRAPLELSPDGKLLYQFGEKITIMQADDFKVVKRLDLSKPTFPGVEMESLHFGGDLDLINEAGQHVAVFMSSDPIVHNNVFGLARFDLASQQFEFKPIGPVPDGMAGIEVTPDRKAAYTVVASGIHGSISGGGGDKRCEFWAFDLSDDHITQRAEVPCRTRFTLGISADGKKLYIYGAGFDIEVYDAATLKYEKTWDLNNDVTYGGIVVIP
jgi:DNA-binding beta-propeller fold protein YncE